MYTPSILPQLSEKLNISCIVFSDDFKIIEFSQNLMPLADDKMQLQIDHDIRECFWEFIGIEDDILKLLNKEQKNFKIPMIYKNSMYYDVEIELLDEADNAHTFMAYILKKSDYSLNYLKSIQEINKKTLILQNDKIKTEKEKNYYEMLNKQLITFHVNSEGIITKANDVCCYFFALSEEELMGHHFSDFFHTRESNIQNSANKIFHATNSIGEGIFFSASVIPITYNDTSYENIIICHDVSYLKRIEKELEYAYAHDGLTGLASRTRLLKKMDEAIIESNKGHHTFSICFIDIKNFKQVNENYGHHAGDMTLKHIASLLSTFVQSSDILSRVGGDKFAIIFTKIENENYIHSMINDLKNLASKNPLLYSEDDVIEFEFNFGISSYPKDAKDAKSLLESAQRDISQYKNITK